MCPEGGDTSAVPRGVASIAEVRAQSVYIYYFLGGPIRCRCFHTTIGLPPLARSQDSYSGAHWTPVGVLLPSLNSIKVRIVRWQPDRSGAVVITPVFLSSASMTFPANE